MIKRAATSILAFLLLFTWVSPSYGADQCHDLFSVDLEPIYKAEIKKLFRAHYSIPERQSKIADLYLWYGLRRFKLRAMETPEDVRQFVSETEHLFQVASKFTGEFQELTPEMLWFQRKVLSRGIDSLVTQYRDVPESHVIIQLIRKIMKTRVVKFMRDLRTAPYFRDNEFGDILFDKIMKDGPVAHQPEILEFYRKKVPQHFKLEADQYAIDKYRQFRKIYSTMFILIASYLTWQSLNTVDDKVNDAEFDKTLKSFDELQELMDLVDQENARRGLYKD